MYLRPSVIGTEGFLGVRPSRTFKYFLILSPVGPYYSGGLDSPLSIYATESYARSVDGGIGSSKTGANYAASLWAAEKAKEEGYDQVLWLDGSHHKYIDEVGTMNVMMVIDGEIITPPLSGTILPGITRDAILTLARDWGMRVAERRIDIDEVLAALRQGRLTEMWGTGTAAVVSSIGRLGYRGQDYVINDRKVGPITRRFKEAIFGIHNGTLPNPYGWTHMVEMSAERQPYVL